MISAKIAYTASCLVSETHALALPLNDAGIVEYDCLHTRTRRIPSVHLGQICSFMSHPSNSSSNLHSNQLHLLRVQKVDYVSVL